MLTLTWLLLVFRLYTQARSPQGGATAAPSARGDVSLRGPGAAVVGTPGAPARAWQPEDGPLAISALAGRCLFFVLSATREWKLELCLEQHTAQIKMPDYQRVEAGTYRGWHAEAKPGGGLRYLYQEYDRGSKCGEGAFMQVTRSTQVHFKCKRDAVGSLYSEQGRGIDLMEFIEYDVCKYRITLGLAAVCDAAD